ncbi:MAG: hypothetical protein COA78_02800 [Blastopirellula sp.]|nr:MAG: hypothetical protein COA78_02800 [Blastopirellula sp.]
MASKDSQGLHVAVILLVLLVVGLGVTTYVFKSSADKAYTAEATAIQNLAAEKVKVDKFLTERNYLKEILGHGPETTIEEIQVAFKADINKWIGADAPAESSDDPNYNYPALASNHFQAMVKSDAEEAKTSELLTAKSAELIAATEQAKKDKIQFATQLAAETKKSTDLAAAASAERAGLQKTQQDLNTRLAQSLAGVQQKVDAANAKAADAAKKLTNAERLIIVKNDQLKENEPKLGDLPDGSVVWVNQKDRKLWINLGTSDYLRPQMSFSVYEKGEANIARAEKKGSIEITRVFDSHQAEATIMDADVANPVMPGDVIFTPIWAPGRKMEFALVGFMDLNNDGKDDTAQIRQAIEVTGGKIAAWVEADGTQKGAITPDTRYLILGAQPTEKSSSAQLAAYTAFKEKARDAGVDSLKLDRFLDRTGLKSVDKLISLGKTSRLEELENSAQKIRDDNEFKKRRPGGSAY